MTITAIQGSNTFAATGADFASVLGKTEPKTLAEQLQDKRDALAAAQKELREACPTLIGNLRDDIAKLKTEITALEKKIEIQTQVGDCTNPHGQATDGSGTYQKGGNTYRID